METGETICYWVILIIEIFDGNTVKHLVRPFKEVDDLELIDE
jgi:hypothetical protein